MQLVPGTRLATFEVLARPDELSPVVRARARGADGKPAVVRAVRLPGAAAARQGADRFVREATTAGALGHASIAPVLAAGLDDGLAWWVTSPCRQALPGRGRLSTHAALSAARDVAHALVAAHDEGIAHGALGAAHVLAGADGAVVVDGFGVAALSAPSVPVDTAADLRAFGALLEAWLARVHAAPPPAQALAQALRADDPARRPASAREVLAVIEPLAIEAAGAARRRRRLRTALLATVAVVAVVAAGSRIALGRRAPATPRPARVAAERPPEAPLYRRLTFRRGRITGARFAPDGDSIVFAASWDAGAVRLSTMRVDSDSHWSSELELPAADVLDVSPAGDMLIALDAPDQGHPTPGATLAQVPMLGRAPRAILEAVLDASWTADGRVAVTRLLAGGLPAIELPPGERRWSGSTWPSHVRPSADGRRLAFFEHPRAGDPGGRLVVSQPDGQVAPLSEGWRVLTGLAWSPDGEQLWLSGARGDDTAALWEVSLAGVERVVAEGPRHLTLQDVQEDGRALVTTDRTVVTVRAASPVGAAPRELAGLDRPTLVDANRDAGLVLVAEHGGGREQALILDATGRAPPVKLGAGQALGLSPDGQFALIRREGSPARLVLAPISGGPDRVLAALERPPLAARLLPDPGTPAGLDVLLRGDAGWVRRELDGTGGGALPDSARFTALAVSPDGRRIAAAAADGLYLAALDEGAPPPHRLTGAPVGAWPLRWTPDGRALLVAEAIGATVRVHRVEVATGRARPVSEIAPPDRAGADGAPSVVVDDTGRAWVLATTHRLSELYVVEGL